MDKILFVVTLCILSIFTGCLQKPQVKQLPQVSIQQKAAHLILYKGKNSDEDLGACSGTVVGPNTIMTGEHCDVAAGANDTISLDLATSERHIQKRWLDGRDHIVYGVDGPAFEDISPIHERPAKTGELIYYYGDPLGAYPPVLYRGQVKPSRDVSEIDRKAGIGYYTLGSEPGCSGSAVYAADGSIIGLITYGDEEKDLFGAPKRSSIGFELNYSPKALDEISKFKPSKNFKKKKKEPEPWKVFSI